MGNVGVRGALGEPGEQVSISFFSKALSNVLF